MSFHDPLSPRDRLQYVIQAGFKNGTICPYAEAEYFLEEAFEDEDTAKQVLKNYPAGSKLFRRQIEETELV